MDDAEDEDYQMLSRAMTKASRSVVAAIERQDFEAVRKSVGEITQSCSDCHEQYR
jgi:cytochrome c556